VCILGPCVVRLAETDEPFEPSLTQRRIVARLAVAQGGVVLADELIDVVWAGDPPRTATAALQNQIARLRDRLGSTSIDTVTAGYRLMLPTDLDLLRTALNDADDALRDGHHADAGDAAARGLQLWRGRALSELDHWRDAMSTRQWLNETHRALEDIRLDAAIASGRLAWAIPEAERLVAQQPDDEHRWARLVAALSRSGRRGDALATLERARRHLAESLGLDLGDELRTVHRTLLTPADGAARATSLPLVGRESLIDSIERSLSDHGMTIVVGEPGIGRTRLIDALARRLRRNGAMVTAVRCSAYPINATATIADLADGLGGVLDPAEPPVHALRTAVLTAVAQHGRVTLLVDDIHLAGPSTIEALMAVVADSGVSVVVSSVADHPVVDALHGRIAVVPPLEMHEVHTLVTAALGRPIGDDDPTIAWYSAMTGGNPAMLECLAESSMGSSVANEPVTSEAARDMVRRRLARLSPAGRAAVEVAAVLGSTCTIDLLDDLNGGRGIDDAIAAGILVRHGADASDDGNVTVTNTTVTNTTDVGRQRLVFRHGALERVVLGDLPPGRRSDLHYHAALWLHSHGGSAEAVATHAVAAHDIAPLEMAEFVITAAREATCRGAHREAAAWFERAITMARRVGPAGARTAVASTIAQADALRLAGDAAHGDRLLTAAEDAVRLGDSTLIGEATYALLQLGESSDSGEMHDQAVAFVDRNRHLVTDRHLGACIDAAASLAHSLTGAPDRCRQLFLDAVDSAEEEHTRRAVLPFAYLALGHPRDSEQRALLADELLALGRAAGDPVAVFEGLQQSFSVAIQRADGAGLRSHLSDMEALVERVGDVGRRWALAYQQAALAHIDGRLDDADALATEALTVFSTVSPDRAVAAYGGQLLGIHIARGTVAELTETLRAMVADSPNIPAWNAALALSLVDIDPIEAAHYACVALENTVDDFVWLAGNLIGGRAAAAVSDHVDRAVLEVYRDRLAPFAGTCCWQGTCSYGPVDTTLAVLAQALGDSDAAVRHAATARHLATRLISPTFLADIDHVLSRAL
jgi:DNA-binding SARP family transcriptional activator